MRSYAYADLIHCIRYMNKERRAGVTACGRYLDLLPKNLNHDVITCVSCLGFVPPECICSRIGGVPLPEDELLAGHDPLCTFVEGLTPVDERIYDKLRDCIQNETHNTERDDGGFCQACGYRFDSNR